MKERRGRKGVFRELVSCLCEKLHKHMLFMLMERVNRISMELWVLFNFGTLVRWSLQRQCRAARGLLAWNQQELAQRAGVGIVTVHQFEAGLSQPRRATLDVIRARFEAAGVEFIGEDGEGLGCASDW